MPWVPTGSIAGAERFASPQDCLRLSHPLSGLKRHRRPNVLLTVMLVDIKNLRLQFDWKPSQALLKWNHAVPVKTRGRGEARTKPVVPTAFKWQQFDSMEATESFLPEQISDPATFEMLTVGAIGITFSVRHSTSSPPHPAPELVAVTAGRFSPRGLLMAHSRAILLRQVRLVNLDLEVGQQGATRARRLQQEHWVRRENPAALNLSVRVAPAKAKRAGPEPAATSNGPATLRSG